eukprot:360465-Chlamydomonas_euryale.AAC.5
MDQGGWHGTQKDAFPREPRAMTRSWKIQGWCYFLHVSLKSALICRIVRPVYMRELIDCGEGAALGNGSPAAA